MPKENLKPLHDLNDSSQTETTTLVDNMFGNTLRISSTRVQLTQYCL